MWFLAGLVRPIKARLVWSGIEKGGHLERGTLGREDEQKKSHGSNSNIPPLETHRQQDSLKCVYLAKVIL